MSNNLQVTEYPGSFGGEVKDISVVDLTDAELSSLLGALYDNRFLVLRTRGVSAGDYVKFARRIGEPIRLSDGSHPEIAVMSNVATDTQAQARGPAHWHSDQSYRRQRASVTMLYCRKTPSDGGETRFCDLAAAYEALSEPMKGRIDDLVVIHRHGVSVAAQPGDHTPIPPPGWDQERSVKHPLVLTHPVTGRKTLYAISGTSQGIVGMDQEESTGLFQELCAHALQPEFVIAHRHSVHDITMWDNPTTPQPHNPTTPQPHNPTTPQPHNPAFRDTPCSRHQRGRRSRGSPYQSDW